jgi:hypothetical protein
MWPSRRERLEQLDGRLLKFSKEDIPLAGLTDGLARQTLAKQMIASLRRLDYTEILKNRHIHPDRANPDSALFDVDTFWETREAWLAYEFTRAWAPADGLGSELPPSPIPFARG